VDLAGSEIGHVAYDGADGSATAFCYKTRNIGAITTVAMNKFGLYSEGPKISIEDHLSRLEEPAKTIFQEIRSFVLSLGSNVIEEVRPHRIVYAKSFNFRTFLDIEPAVNFLALSVKTGPKGESTKLTISSKDQMQDLKELLKQAYARI